MLYAVIDTNVFVSAFITHNLDSATAKIVDYMFHGRINPLYNDEIIAEYEEVLSRDHFHISLAKRQTLFEYIRRKGTTAERVISNKIFIDETDRVFYEVTLSKEDSFLVTGNLKHYPKEPRVVTPAEMLEILEKD